MDTISLRRANIAIVVAGILMIVYVATLLWSNYSAQTRFIIASQKRYLNIFEKQAMAVGYFFSEREQDLRDLSHCKAVSTYFENKALGMSLAYGLTTSLMGMHQHLSKLAGSRKIGKDKVYNWIAFVQPDGVPIAGVFPSDNMESKARFKRISDMALNSMDIMLVEKNNETHAIITVPYFFKNRFKGYIAADVPLRSVLNNLVDAKKISAASHAHIYCTACGVLFPADGKDLAKWLNAHVRSQSSPSGILHMGGMTKDSKTRLLIYARINQTSLRLINVFPDDEFSNAAKPRDTLLLLALLSVFIFGGMGLLIRSNIQRRMLSTRYIESHRNEKEFKRQNETLSREITQRRAMEKALGKANKELRETSIMLNCMLTSATEFAIAAIDPEYRIIHFNPAAERILDIKSGAVMGQTVLDIHSLRKVEKNRFESAIAIAEKEGKYEYNIVFQKGAHGISRRLHAVVMPMHDDEKKTVGFIFFAVDITKQYRSEERLRLSEEKYRTLIENMPDIVFSVDDHFLISDINLPITQSYGLKAEQLIKTSFEHVIHKEDLKSVLSLTRADLRRGKKYRRGVRFRVVPGDGESHWVDLNLQYRYDHDGTFLSAHGVLRNITEQKLLEEQLIRSERMAVAGQLAASIAHDINSPLAGISALLALVRRRNSHDPPALENIDLIQKAVERIGNTVKNLLNLNRPGLNAMQTANVNTIIHDTVTLSRAYLKKQGIRVIMDLSPSVPVFDCHPQELGQIFLNLINNTIEAMAADSRPGKPKSAIRSSPKEIVIRTTVFEDKIVVEYRDTGPGIASQDLDKIFDPFFTSKKTMGMGVGLSICHDIVVRHDGSFRALPTTMGAHFIIEFCIPHQDPSLEVIPIKIKTVEQQ